MKVAVEDLIRLECDIADRVNALASAARRRLITGAPDGPDPEAVTATLLQVRAMLADVEQTERYRCRAWRRAA